MNEILLMLILFSGIFGLLGIILLCVGLGIAENIRKKQKCCTAVSQGRIVGYRRHPDSGNYISYTNRTTYASNFPVIEFYPGEKPVQLVSHFGTTRPKFSVGEAIKVCYNPMNYQHYYIVGYHPQKILATVFTAIGAGLMAAALIILPFIFTVQ